MTQLYVPCVCIHYNFNVEQRGSHYSTELEVQEGSNLWRRSQVITPIKLSVQQMITSSAQAFKCSVIVN